MEGVVGIAVIINVLHREWMELVLQTYLFKLSPFDVVE
jgi:hypothetical protein